MSMTLSDLVAALQQLPDALGGEGEVTLTLAPRADGQRNEDVLAALAQRDPSLGEAALAADVDLTLGQDADHPVTQLAAVVGDAYKRGLAEEIAAAHPHGTGQLARALSGAQIGAKGPPVP